MLRGITWLFTTGSSNLVSRLCLSMGTNRHLAPLLRDAPCEAVADAGRATHSVPLQLALSASGELAVARWHNPVVSAPLAPPDRHLLIFHERGCTAVEGRIGSFQGHGSRVGSVTVVPAGMPSQWRLHGACDVIHAYLQPSRLRTADGAVQDLAPAFARQDGRLQNWFALLSTQMTELQRCGDALPPLLADQFEGLLVSHLVSGLRLAACPRGGLAGVRRRAARPGNACSTYSSKRLRRCCCKVWPPPTLRTASA